VNSKQYGRGRSPMRRANTLRESAVPLTVTTVHNLAGACPTDDWEATYFSVGRQGDLRSHQVGVCIPAGLAEVCPRIRIGQPGCVYAVRRWGFALRPSALEAASFDLKSLLTTHSDSEAVRAVLQAAAFDLPGEFIIASPEHPFRLVAPDGTLRGSSIQWRTYLGAAAFFASDGRVDAPFIRFWLEAEESYGQALEYCRMALTLPLEP
jgi:hypothetical protein